MVESESLFLDDHHRRFVFHLNVAVLRLFELFTRIVQTVRLKGSLKVLLRPLPVDVRKLTTKIFVQTHLPTHYMVTEGHDLGDIFNLQSLLKHIEPPDLKNLCQLPNNLFLRLRGQRYLPLKQQVLELQLEPEEDERSGQHRGLVLVEVRVNRDALAQVIHNRGHVNQESRGFRTALKLLLSVVFRHSQVEHYKV